MKRKGPLVLLLLTTNLVFVFLLWLARPELIGRFFVLLGLFSAGLLTTAYLLEKRADQVFSDALFAFLNKPDENSARRLLDRGNKRLRPALRQLVTRWLKQEERLEAIEQKSQQHQAFIEAWVHEIKTPIALAELVLANHKDKIPVPLYQKLLYVQRRSGQLVENILLDARLRSDPMDLVFEPVRLDDLVQEHIQALADFVEEQNLTICQHNQRVTVFTDRRTLAFILRQVLGNACKYADKEVGCIWVTVGRKSQQDPAVVLSIRNNGQEVLAADRPFLFDRGFVGDQPQRQQATGMGLYWVKAMAQRLSIDVSLEKPEGFSFGIRLVFPHVDQLAFDPEALPIDQENQRSSHPPRRPAHGPSSDHH